MATIAPSLIEYFTYDNKKKIVAIKLSNGTINTIIENKNIITHYKELFELKNRIAKIIYKKLVIANIWTNEEEKILKPKSTIIEELQKYNIQYTNPKQKERLFKEIKEAVEELKEKNIIQSYRLIPVEDTARKNIITDYRMELKPTITFNKNHVMSQKLLKKLLPID